MNTPKNVQTILNVQTTDHLVAIWESLQQLGPKDPDWREHAQVRDWVMDELEDRDPAAFAAWVESDEPSPRKFFNQ